jgi:NAD(P)-dependent dehydrogenase (short-subunit alcohol dehydrogenase family)
VAIGLAGLGASLVLLCRDRDRGASAASMIARLTGNNDIDLLIADLGSQAQIRAAAAEFLESGRPLHVLLNNAGLIATRWSVTEDGVETTFAVNHLGPFLLTNLVLARLRESAPARIINVSSDMHKHAYGDGRIAFDDLNGMERYAGRRAYAQSKLANILFTRELARRLEGAGVTANAVHPGFVGSNFGRNNKGLLPLVLKLCRPFIRTVEKGAETPLWLASAPELDGVTGGYFFDRAERQPNCWALDDEDAARLWEASERMTGGF